MKKLSIIVISIVVFMLAVGVAGAMQGGSPPVPVAIQANVSGAISYQGRLTNPGGSPLNGTYTMRFIVYDDEFAGSALWDSGNLSVSVEDGLFNVQLGVPSQYFDGRALWVNIMVGGETLSPRQEILPAPYALSLRPGAYIRGDSLPATGAALSGFAPATGTALYANANGGVGVFGDSTESYGVQGESNNGWGGYFTSENGYGLRVNTNGTDHYDHGAYITSNGGYGLYVQSTSNQGVRSEAGNISGVSLPLGPIGVVGLGQNRGVVGSSNSGIGVYASSTSNYGVWGQSASYRGVTGRTSRSDNNYGFYTPDNIFSSNYNRVGAVMQVMQNNGTEPLLPGDVVVFNGINQFVAAVDSPVVQVKKVDTANSTAVAGVVFSRFNIDAVDPDFDISADTVGVANRAAAMEVTPAGNVAPGEYVLVVVQGLAQVRVNTVESTAIHPGDLLSAASVTGTAGRVATVTQNNVETALPGAVFGKALDVVDGAQDMMYVYVTLQ